MTDYTKLTKQELIQMLEQADINIIEELRLELADVKRTNEELRNAEFTRNEEKNKLIAQITTLGNQVADEKQKVGFLEMKLNELANVFEAYANSFKDQVSLIGVLHRNAKSIEELLDSKIEKYNGGNDK